MADRLVMRDDGWPCWLTDSGRLNRKVVSHPASSLAQDRESSPAETSVLTTMLHRLSRLRAAHIVTVLTTAYSNLIRVAQGRAQDDSLGDSTKWPKIEAEEKPRAGWDSKPLHSI